MFNSSGRFFHKSYLLLFLMLGSYALLILPFTSYMQSKPFFEKLGTLPRIEVIKFVAADQKELVGAGLVLKVMVYFGGLMSNETGKYKLPPEYQTMSKIIHGAVKLDPYNMDAYYFAQALLVWDTAAYRIATDLLVYGMKYRTWDWYLPFFAGFNSAYFLKEYDNAAVYYKKAAELSGEPLFATLAGRYMQKSGKTDMAIAYLATMVKSAKNPSIRKSYQVRLSAFKAVRVVEAAIESYSQRIGTPPPSLESIMAAGFLKQIPEDPYGGRFYITNDGRVATTSEFSFSRNAE
jgi:tetratricopeptide (TPR) repeat protein